MTTEQRGSSAGPEPDGLPVEPAPPDEDPTGPESAVHPTRVEQVVVPRRLQAVALAAVLFGLSALGRASRPELLLFVVAGVIALILNPLVEVLQRVGLQRGVAIGVVLPLKASSYATGVARRDRAAIAAAQPAGRGHTGITARLVAWSVSDEADWVTGQVLTLDGGWSSRR